MLVLQRNGDSKLGTVEVALVEGFPPHLSSDLLAVVAYKNSLFSEASCERVTLANFRAVQWPFGQRRSGAHRFWRWKMNRVVTLVDLLLEASGLDWKKW